MSTPFKRSDFTGYTDNQAKYLRIGWNAAVKALRALTQPGPEAMTTETITWIPVEQRLPDPDTTVLVALDDTHDEPTWIGFCDGDTWRDISARPIKGVLAWADMPKGVAGGASPISAPVATIHVDGSFIHVEWHGAAPNQCHMPVYAAPPDGAQEPTAEQAEFHDCGCTGGECKRGAESCPYPYGVKACPTCNGVGTIDLFGDRVQRPCPTCARGVQPAHETSDQLVTKE